MLVGFSSSSSRGRRKVRQARLGSRQADRAGRVGHVSVDGCGSNEQGKEMMMKKNHLYIKGYIH